MLITAGITVLVSMVVGWENRGELLREDHVEEGAWLRSSQVAARGLDESAGATRSATIPAILASIAVALGLLLSFVIFW